MHITKDNVRPPADEATCNGGHMEPGARDDGPAVIRGGHAMAVHDAQGEPGHPVGVMPDKAVETHAPHGRPPGRGHGRRPRPCRGGDHRAAVRRRRACVPRGDAAAGPRDIIEVVAAASVVAAPFIICPILGAALGWL